MALLMVLWAIVLAVIVVSSLQSASFAQATAGREALARVRALWAARAGVEATIARLEYDTENPESDNAFREVDDMAAVAEGEFDDASYRVSWTGPSGEEVLGAIDAHSRLNINRASVEELGSLTPMMLEDTIAGILDWIDGDDEPNPVGAEVGYYQSLPFPYEPRNGAMGTLQELELVLGATPEDVRGEDWNLNALLDPGEDDGNAGVPNDNGDGKLDAGWSGLLTAESVEGGNTPGGNDPLDLGKASSSEVASRIGCEGEQGDVIVRWAAEGQNATMGDYLRRQLRQLDDQLKAGQQPRPPASRVQALSPEQLALLFNECRIAAVDEQSYGPGPVPGKINVNTASFALLEMLPEVGTTLAEAIVSERDARAKGFASFADLEEVPGLSRSKLAALYDVLGVRSNVYVVRSRGKDTRSGVEVELLVTIDRSHLPVQIRGVRVQ